MKNTFWARIAAVSLLVGTAYAWGVGSSAAQLMPSRGAILDSQGQQIQEVQYRRHDGGRRHFSRRDGRRHFSRRDGRRHFRRHFVGHRRFRHRDNDIFFSFGLAAPYYAAPYVAPPYIAAPGTSACSSAVVVRRGDTLARIAARCGTTVGALLRANPQIANPNVIVVGEAIRMPWA